jgi:hypothetical protein
MAVHLYGIVAEDAPLPDRPGRGDAKLRLVTSDGLGVIVSDADEHARVAASDLLAHARVLESCVEESTVIPMQFGILLPDDAAVRGDVIEPDHDALTQLLHTFDGLVQLSVRVFQEEEPAMRVVLSRYPELSALRERVRETVPAAPVSEQLRLGEGVSRALTDLAAEYADVVAPRLAERARATSAQETQGVNEVLNAAYLVGRSEQGDFGAAVSAVREAFADQLLVRFVGPQPPYSFIDAAQEGRATWA